MRGGLIAANPRRQTTAPGLGEPANRVAADVVEPETVRELETEPAAIVGKPGGIGYIARNQERLLRRHQPATPLSQHLGININAKDPHALSCHPRTLTVPACEDSSMASEAVATQVRVSDGAARCGPSQKAMVCLWFLSMAGPACGTTGANGAAHW